MSKNINRDKNSSLETACFLRKIDYRGFCMNNTNFSVLDEYFMRLALEQATKAKERGEVPVGAIVVFQDHILGAAGNQRETDQDPTAHAEMLALRQAAKKQNSWRLIDATLYVTQEPCLMCAGALIHARISRLVYGCKNPKAGAIHTLYQVATDSRLNHNILVDAGLLAEECSQLLSQFFSNLRSLGKK